MLGSVFLGRDVFREWVLVRGVREDLGRRGVGERRGKWDGVGVGREKGEEVGGEGLGREEVGGVGR